MPSPKPRCCRAATADIAMQIDPDTAKTIRSNDVTVETVPSYNFVYVALSPGSEGQQGEADAGGPRGDLRSPSTDKAIIDFTLGGDGQLDLRADPARLPGRQRLPERSPTIRAKAKDLLAKAGMPTASSWMPPSRT